MNFRKQLGCNTYVTEEKGTSQPFLTAHLDFCQFFRKNRDTLHLYHVGWQCWVNMIAVSQEAKPHLVLLNWQMQPWIIFVFLLIVFPQIQRSSLLSSFSVSCTWTHCWKSGTRHFLWDRNAICSFFSPERHYCNVILSSHIRSNGDSGLSQDAYTYQIILEKNDVGPCPSVQQLIETSFNSCDLKFEEVSETEVKLEVRWRPRAVKTFALPSVQTFNTSYTKTILDHMTYFPCFNHPFVVGPIVPHGSDAKIWKKLQDVSLRHSLYRTWYHRPLTSMWVPNGQSFL